jgi:hypothetical protein
MLAATTDNSFQQLMRICMDLTRLLAAWRSAVEGEMRSNRELREEPFVWDPEFRGDSETPHALQDQGLRTRG